MKNIVTKTGMIMLALVLFSANGWATDYSRMSNEELAALRGTMQKASPEDHDAFRAEWRSRLQNMSAEEQQKFLGHPPSTTNYQSGPRYQEHSGNGPGDGYGTGVDGGQGPGGLGSGYGGGSGSGRGGGGGRR